LAYTAIRETAGVARSVNTQPLWDGLNHQCLLLLIILFCQ
jgi:hypothetical protein